jgi:hypothetical protein
MIYDNLSEREEMVDVVLNVSIQVRPLLLGLRRTVAERMPTRQSLYRRQVYLVWWGTA